ncbi:hypothetical protein LA080_010030 [Diaporthe eres]|uniref:DUF7492 domain-containing protein n=1 Tax=Diaporthe vaccinii TaxID=105482 RepID=A0ABR4FBD0_9PEZI|nr:hypothetical protein LA080_010030 [Diaporthe eres]
MEKSFLFLLLLSGCASAHTWLEALLSITSNGSFASTPGFPRGFVARSDTSFSDNSMTYRITAKNATTPLCHPSQQVANGYNNPQYPRLNASAGSWISLTYQENGHVSAPQVPEGRPYRSGNVYVYASTTLRDEEFASVHGNWTADNSLESGRLIATHFFDDEICFQNQGSNPSPINSHRKAAAKNLSSVNCQTDIQLPDDITSDVLALYWVWDWSLWPNMDNTSFEAYTTCAEIDIASGGTASSGIVINDSVPLDQRALQSQLATKFEVLELGTGTAAPPPVTSLPPTTNSSVVSPTTTPTTPTTGTTTPRKANECSGITVGATITVTVTAGPAPSD